LGKHLPHPADKSEEMEPNTMFNKVILIGRLGQNAEAKTAQNNREYVVLNIATQESWKNDKGDYETRTERHRVQRGDDPTSGQWVLGIYLDSASAQHAD
jgi:hypothetical protein